MDYGLSKSKARGNSSSHKGSFITAAGAVSDFCVLTAVQYHAMLSVKAEIK